MNKTAIKNFAIWARRKLIADIGYKAGLLGITECGINSPLPQSTKDAQFFDIGTQEPYPVSGIEIKQREKLVDAINENTKQSDYGTAYKSIIEEVAYTWFNRLIAIRFMEVNEYLPSGIRVLSATNPNKDEPDLVTTPFQAGIELTTNEQEYIKQLTQENKMDRLFRFLFIKQCNELNAILPNLFEKTRDYTELLLNASFSDKEGVVYRLVNDIEENDFKDAVEIIGWLYQYYNTEPKDEVFSLLKKNVKITKERIPAATQLFTPDWIVRYMVENSLGRLWAEGHPSEELKASWKYYLEEAGQEGSVNLELEKIRNEYKLLPPNQIKIIDPCMGSGHILVYAFDVLMQIYQSQGYTKEDAAVSILENNLYGFDIDARAYQLAYFAIMMRARKYNRYAFSVAVSPMLFSIKESNGIAKAHLKYFGATLSKIERGIVNQQMEYLVDAFNDAKEYGSILNIDECNWDLLQRSVQDINNSGQISLENFGVEQTQRKFIELIEIAKCLAQKYDVVVTNPPYMNLSGGSELLNKYVKKNYPASKADIFAVFIEKCNHMTKNNGFTAMITQHSWMFLSGYEALRSNVLKSTIINMIHLGSRAFDEIGGEVVQATTWIQIKTDMANFNAKYIRVVEYKSQQSKEQAFLMKKHIHLSCKENYEKIPTAPISYWVSTNEINLFANNDCIDNFANPRQGLATGNNNHFLRLWHEINFPDYKGDACNMDELLFSEKKYIPYNKGGGYRKWYANTEWVIRFDKKSYSILQTVGNHLPSKEFYFKESITWSKVSTGGLSMRYMPVGSVFDVAGCSIFSNTNLFYILGFANSSSMQHLISILSQTMNYEVGSIKLMPLIISAQFEMEIIRIVKENIALSKEDISSFETSKDFISNPLTIGTKSIEAAYCLWESKSSKRFIKIKENEEKLNCIFAEIYNLNETVETIIDDTRISVSKANLNKDIKGFISYAVGCMFGRYSLGTEGLSYAGGKWDSQKYKSFIPDIDNCIPITDEEYFNDDIVGRFIEFVRCVYGSETLEENLDFIAKALNSNGTSSREVIRNYFVKDFFNDHIKAYQKRPIFWLYDSGKENGFKALIYIHRYSPDTTGMVRVEYLHKIQKIYEGEIERLKDLSENTSDSREKSQAEKRRDKLVKQLKETQEYDEKIAHLALSRIEIDLDDGVVNNYQKIQTDNDGKMLKILSEI